MELSQLALMIAVLPAFVWIFDRWIYFGGSHSNFLIVVAA